MAIHRRPMRCHNCGGPILWKIKGVIKGTYGSGFGYYVNAGHSCEKYLEELRESKIDDILEYE